MPDLSIEKKKNNLNYKLIAGVDEAGRGPWAGPVYSAAVILDTANIPAEINDSKKMSEKKRNEIYSRIVSEHHCAVGIADVNEIDELNILQASLLSMKRAITNLLLKPDFVLIDGAHKPALDIDSENIIKECIHTSIRKLLPVRHIIREYLGDTDNMQLYLSSSYKINHTSLTSKWVPNIV